MTRLVIFHYHLEQGGVTNVIELSVSALLQFGHSLSAVTLVSGRRANAEALFNNLKNLDAAAEISLTLQVHRELDYQTATDMPVDREQAILQVKSILQEFGRESVLWIHNFHLGKNPIFTQALLEIARDNPEQKIVFHIHDFPESSRYQNLSYLKMHLSLPLYPVSSNVRYGVINARDLKFLVQAGIPKEQVFLLNNPVLDSSIDRSNQLAVKYQLASKFGHRFPHFEPDHPLLLFPVRTIRRKNVLEAGFIAALYDEPINLVVTLPGVSELEKPYSDKVELAYSSGLIRGMWGIGGELEQHGFSFTKMIGCCDVIVSSSIQEGFGYQFVNALQWGIPLFARYLDVLDGFRDIFDSKRARFYQSILVPVDSAIKSAITHKYQAQVETVSGFLPEKAKVRLMAQIAQMMSADRLDFSYLDVDTQIQLLKRIRESSDYRKQTQLCNSATLDSLEAMMNVSTPQSGLPDQRFTLKAYADAITTVIHSFDQKIKKRTHPERLPEEILVDLFADISTIRLLYS